MDRIHLAQDRVLGREERLFGIKNVNLLTGRATINFSIRPQAPEVRQLITMLTKLWHWILSCATRVQFTTPFLK